MGSPVVKLVWGCVGLSNYQTHPLPLDVPLKASPSPGKDSSLEHSSPPTTESRPGTTKTEKEIHILTYLWFGKIMK